MYGGSRGEIPQQRLAVSLIGTATKDLKSESFGMANGPDWMKHRTPSVYVMDITSFSSRY